MSREISVDDDLTDKGLFRRIQPARSSARYENRVGDNCVAATTSSGGQKHQVTGTEPSDGTVEEEEHRRVSER